MAFGYGRHLGDYYKNVGNEQLAKKYYLEAMTESFSGGMSDWNLARGREAYDKYVKLLSHSEKKKFYLNKIKTSENPSDWQKEMAVKAFEWLKGTLLLSEKLELIFKDTNRNTEIKCEISKNLYNKSFQSLLVELEKKQKKQKFINLLCKNQKEYFVGLTFENGLGNKEDFREAYRLFLIAGSKGNTDAKVARDRIRDNLSSEQISQATCLADYGLEPNVFRKWKCGW